MRAPERCGVAALAALAYATAAAAQDSDPLRAPRILDTPAAPAPAAPEAPSVEPEPRAVQLAAPLARGMRRPPNAARLAPLPEQRVADGVEEIIVIGQGWRLPDLGSEWRARQEEAESEGRFSATILPLYDPAEPPLRGDAFTGREQRRHGYIELFRLRFGRRTSD